MSTQERAAAVRDVPPFRLRAEFGEVVLGHVACGKVTTAGAMDPWRARELAAALLALADIAEAEERAMFGTVGEILFPGSVPPATIAEAVERLAGEAGEARD